MCTAKPSYELQRFLTVEVALLAPVCKEAGLTEQDILMTHTAPFARPGQVPGPSVPRLAVTKFTAAQHCGAPACDRPELGARIQRAPAPALHRTPRRAGRRAGPELQPPRPPGPRSHGIRSTRGDTKELGQVKPPSQGLEGQMDSPNGEAETNADTHTQEGEVAGCLGTGGTAAVRTQDTSGLAGARREPSISLRGPRVPHAREPGFQPRGKVQGRNKGDYALKRQAEITGSQPAEAAARSSPARHCAGNQARRDHTRTEAKSICNVWVMDRRLARQETFLRHNPPLTLS